MNNLLKNTVWMTLSHLLSRGGLVICGILISKFFNYKEFANYSYLILTVTTVAIYSAVGIGVTTTKFYANLKKDNNSPVLLLGIISLIFAIIGSLTFLNFSNLIIPSTITINLNLLACIILFMSVDIYASNALIGLEKYKDIFYGSFCSLVINFIAIFYSILKSDIYYAFLGLLIAIFTQTLLNFLFLFKSLHKNKFIENLTCKISHFSKIGKTVGPMVLVSLLAASGTWIVGKYILNHSLNGLNDFAIFSIGLQWYSLALFIPTMLSKVFLPALIKGNLHNNTLKYNCLAIMVFCVFLSFLSYLIYPLIIDFYGLSYNIPVFYIPVFFIIAGINACCNILGNKIISSNQELIWFGIVFLSFLILNICCVLFDNLGADLAILALGLSNVSMILMILIYFFVKKKNYHNL